MSVATGLGYFFAVICVLASLYVAFSRDLLRVTIAFFIELASVSGVLLSLNADYLALVVFAVALMGSIVVITFSSVIMGSLKHSFSKEAAADSRTGRGLVTKIFGMLLGLGLGGVIGWAFVTGPIPEEVKTSGRHDPSIILLGRMMLGEQVAVLELLAMLVLVVVVGAGLLLRKPNDAN